MKIVFIRVIIIGLVFLLASCVTLPPATLTPIIQPSTAMPTLETPSKKTPTGFYWPTSPPIRAYYSGFLADSCTKLTGNHNYFDNQYHVGTDIQASLDSPVKAISDGIVLYYSHNANWGTDNRDGQVNDGLVIKHYLEDGNIFYAVYGHIRTKLREGNIVSPGEIIGSIGMWRYEEKGVWIRGKDHLHFGIQQGEKFLNPSHWGIMNCPDTLPLDPKGFEHPINFINNQVPGPIPSPIAPTSTPTIIPTNTPVNSNLISGKWYWEQTSGPYSGYFYITQSGNTFSGTLDDVWEGTYGDKVIDGIINGSSFSFTRDGRYGIQFWYGTIDINNGVMEINNGLWQKQGWLSDYWLPFHAEFISPNY